MTKDEFIARLIFMIVEHSGRDGDVDFCHEEFILSYLEDCLRDCDDMFEQEDRLRKAAILRAESAESRADALALEVERLKRIAGIP